MRLAHELGSLLHAQQEMRNAHLIHRLNGMENALGDMRGSMLLARWIRLNGLTLTPPLQAALDGLVRGCLARCQRHRKPPRAAIRNHLSKTR
jgi:hypothetical protein